MEQYQLRILIEVLFILNNWEKTIRYVLLNSKPYTRCFDPQIMKQIIWKTDVMICSIKLFTILIFVAVLKFYTLNLKLYNDVIFTANFRKCIIFLCYKHKIIVISASIAIRTFVVQYEFRCK